MTSIAYLNTALTNLYVSVMWKSVKQSSIPIAGVGGGNSQLSPEPGAETRSSPLRHQSVKLSPSSSPGAGARKLAALPGCLKV